MKARSLKDRLMEKVFIPEDQSECWIFMGCRSSQGYGSIKVGRRSEKAHRVAYQLFVGELPPATDPAANVLHACGNGHLGCVNPKHLYLGDKSRNAQDMIKMGRSWQLNRKACPYGHPYDSVNTHIRQNGARQCRSCERERMRVRRALQLAAEEGVRINYGHKRRSQEAA
jgi:hypothetical protein